MKRCLSLALVLALFGTTAFTPVLAEGFDVVGEAGEAAIVEVDPFKGLGLEAGETTGAAEEAQQETGEPVEQKAPEAPAEEGSAPEASGEAEEKPAEDSDAQPGQGDAAEESDAQPEQGDDGEGDDAQPEQGDAAEGSDAQPGQGDAAGDSDAQPEHGDAAGDSDEEPEQGDSAGDSDEEEEEDSDDDFDEFIEEGSESAEEDASDDIVGLAAATIKLATGSITIGVKETYKVAATPVDEKAALPAVTWRSGNKAVAKVDASTGVITGVKAGKATIYAKAANSNTEVRCKVVVKAKPDKVELNDSSLSLSAGMTAQLKASVPKDTACATMTWSTDKSSVATVDANGRVTAHKAGTANITVKTYNGKKDTCKITVTAAPASAVFPDAVFPMAVGQTATVKATARTAKGAETPALFTYGIESNSPDAGCVTVNASTGELKAVRKGRAYLKATTHNGITILCQIDVDVAPKAIELNTSSISVGAKEVYGGLVAKLTAPDGAGSCAQVVNWTSSDRSIVTVDARSGVVTGVKAGSATITASTPNGKTAKCKVKVYKEPTSISISPAVGSLNVGERGQYKISLSSGAGGSLTYESSNTKVAVIDNSGVVTAIAPGTVKITVTAYNGKSKTAELMVNGYALPEEDDGKKAANAEKIQYLLSIARTKLGRPYVYGSFGPNSFDCSGFAYWCFKQINIKLKDSAYKQGYDSTYPMVALGQLRPGDLVFFNTVDDNDLSDHTGIYLGNGEFIHASSAAGEVVISKLKDYYKRNFSWGRRVLL